MPGLPSVPMTASSSPLAAHRSLLLGLVLLATQGADTADLCGLAVADADKAVSAKAGEVASRAFRHFARHRSCAECVLAGGAWCLADGQQGGARCVPDARGMCGKESQPQHHVGLAGYGRCAEANQFEAQVYRHAPRIRPKAAPSSHAETSSPPCPSRCNPSGLGVDAGDPSATQKAQSTFEACGAVSLHDAVPTVHLQALRQALRQALPLDCHAEAAASKYALPGVRGTNRHELVIPATSAWRQAVAGFLQRPAVGPLLRQLLGYPVHVEFVSLMVSWPGAAAQEYHRDAAAGQEAALLIFVPLDAMALASPGAAGPPELCMCSQWPSVDEADCRHPVAGDTNTTAPLGSILIYNAGLVHRGTAHLAAEGEPRILLHISVAPARANVRARPEAFLGPAAASHVHTWRSTEVAGGEPSCADLTAQGCMACRKTPARGCAWCLTAKACVPDLAGVCEQGPRDHVGAAGLQAGCPAAVPGRQEL